MIDASHIKVHPDAAGFKGGNQEIARTEGAELARGINPVIPLKSKRRKSKNYDQDLYKLRPKGSFLLGNLPNQGSGTLG